MDHITDPSLSHSIMEPECTSVDTASNSDEQSSDSRDSKIGVYCTLRSRSSVPSSLSSNPKQKAYKLESGEDYAMKDALTAYCTVGRRLKNFIKANSMDTNAPYTKLDESLSTSSTNFGMSNDLSTESIKNACDFYDQSDDEIDPKQSVEAVNSSLLDKFENKNFQRSVGRSSARTSSFDRKRRYENFHPYCTMRRDRYDRHEQQGPEPVEVTAAIPPNLERYCSTKLNQDSVEAYNILHELDAILDNHESVEISSPSSSSVTPEKVEDYLFELDAYLEQMDQSSKSTDDQQQNQEIDAKSNQTLPTKRFHRSKTLPKKLHHRSIGTDILEETPESMLGSSSDTSLDRGHNYRSTIGPSRNSNDRAGHIQEKSSKRRQKSWRRYSMRKTALLELPDHQQNSVHHQSTSQSSRIPERLGQENADNSNTSQSDLISTSFAMASSSLPTANSIALVGNTNNSLEDFHIFNTINLTTNSGSQNHPETSQELRRCVSDADCAIRNGLTHIDIINDILQSTSCDDAYYQYRPRQLGRRAEVHPRVVSIMAETSSSGNAPPRITVNHDRPISAPAAATNQRVPSTLSASTTTTANNRRYISSEPSSVGSSRNPSPVSLLSSTASSSMASTSVVPPVNSVQRRSEPLDEPQINEESNINSQWPHGFSRTLALLCCTLGLFNISRFSVLTIHYGGNFLLQFLILSIIFGIPMLWLQMCLGAKIKSGPISMWKISPICKGIGISLTLAQCTIAIYSAISLAWCLVYFLSVISSHDKYPWQEQFHFFRRTGNVTNNLTETVPDYFNGFVLQRWLLSENRKDHAEGVRFQLACTLFMIWTGIFSILCKGLKSFGKIVLGLTLLPLVIFTVICCKFLYIVDFSTVQNIFSATDFEDFLVNSKSWTAAAQETFLTWGLLGPSVVAISAKSAEKSEGKTILRRDAIIVVLLTLVGLSVAGIFGYACIQILQKNDYVYLPGSFEYTDTYTFLYSLQVPIPSDRLGVPVKWAPHFSTVMGECYRRSTSTAFRESGFQALRLITELFPATVAVATQEFIPQVWTLVTYLMFLIFGLGQLCAMWKPISSILGNSTSSVLLSCVAGLLLGIPFATEMGLSLIHYLDYVIGGAWWLLLLWTAQIFGVFLIRGRPYNGDVLVNDLRMASSMSAFLALSWNVLLPIGLVTLSIINYKVTASSQLFYWRGKSYFSLWSRKLGGLIQIGFLLIVPITAIIQIYKYLSSGPPDLFDRIQLLYRPAILQDHHRNRPNIERLPHHQNTGANLTNIEAQQVQDDAPPKYTPPPSYTTATGARLAKLLRQSIRRSVRRIIGEPSRLRPSISTGAPQGNTSTTPLDSSLPPEYSTVLSNPSGDECSQLEIGPRALYNSHTQRTVSLERYRPPQQFSQSNAGNSRQRNAQTFTAFDVAQVLRSSRHERSASAITAIDCVLRTSSLRQHKNKSRSVENLVMNAAPLGESNAMVANSNTADSNESTSVI